MSNLFKIDALHWCYVFSFVTFCFVVPMIAVELTAFLYKSNKYYRKCNKFVFLTTSAIIITYGNVVIDCYHVWDSFEYTKKSGNIVGPKFTIIMCVSDVFYYVANIFTYIVFIHRVYYTFKNSRYAIRKIHLVFLTIILVMDTVAIFIYVFCLTTFFANAQNSSTDMLLIVLSFDTINDIAINITLLYLFLTKLRRIVLNLNFQSIDELSSTQQQHNDRSTLIQNVGNSKETIDIDHDNNESTETDENLDFENMYSDIFNLDDKQKEIVYIMTKVSLLTIIAALFAQSFNIITAFNEYTFSGNGYTEKLYIGAIIAYTCRGIEGFINCTVLYLMFTFSINEYKFCCGKCHKCLYSSCILNVKQNIRKDTQLKYDSMSNLQVTKVDKHMSIKLLDMHQQ